MKLLLTKEDRRKVQRLLEVKEANIAMANMLWDYFCLSNYPPADNPNDYLNNMLDYWDLDMKDEDNISFINNHLRNHIECLDTNFLENNIFFKNIKISKEKINNCYYDFEIYKPYQAFSYGDIINSDAYYNECSQIAYFEKEARFPVLKYKDSTWMSISPNEIKTMEKAIEHANGDVLIFGLGLGYFAYNVALKDDVKTITIIDNDENVIALFNKQIRPQFPKKTINIIKNDGLSFLKNNKNRYDYVYVDLWYDPTSGIKTYIAFKQLEKNYPNTVFDYWLEESLIALFRRCYLTVIEEQLDNLDDKHYLKAKNDIDQIINKIYFKTKHITINNFDEILDLLRNENLIRLIKVFD